jgi:hypothetical protein
MITSVLDDNVGSRRHGGSRRHDDDNIGSRRHDDVLLDVDEDVCFDTTTSAGSRLSPSAAGRRAALMWTSSFTAGVKEPLRQPDEDVLLS